jgi:hypothetical protein
MANDTAVIGKIIEDQLDRALDEGRIPRGWELTGRVQIEELTAGLQKLKEQVVERKYEPGELCCLICLPPAT